MNESVVRTLFGKASGAISMADGRGKSNGFTTTPTGTYTGGGSTGSSSYGTTNGYIRTSMGTGLPAMGTISVGTYKGFTIQALYSRIYNFSYTQSIALVLVGDSSASIPSVTFVTPSDWGTLSAVYSGGYTYYTWGGDIETGGYTHSISGLAIQILPA